MSSKKSTGIENRHSETALFAALCRAVAFADQYGDDNLASCFLPVHLRFLIRFGFVRQSFRKKNEQMTPGGYEYVLARTRFFDELFRSALSEHIPQIVLLGAGYDSRAARFSAENAGTRIYELDAPTTQERKLSCLERSGMDKPKNVKFLPVDFNKMSVAVALAEAGFCEQEETLFLWEGVTMYLEPGSVSEMLSFIGSHPKSSVGFDYVLSIPEQDRASYFGVSKFMETWEKHRTNEPFQYTASEQGMESLLRKNQLKTCSHMNDGVINNSYTPEDKGLGPVTGFFRFLVASTMTADD